MKILVTGAAGFIGFHACRALMARGAEVVGVDVINDYYDPALKQARLAELGRSDAFSFEKLDLADAEVTEALVKAVKPERILHLAAQAGVRYSLENPLAYGRSNMMGHLSVIEAARRAECVRHLVYASSSSVYGERDAAPFSEEDRVDDPASLYAATKRSGELMSNAYSSLYGLTQTGLRFFTVYGPWGRPDMAYWLFAEAMMRDEPIHLFNGGEMVRDFTYIDDVIDTLVRVVEDAPESGRHRLFNIGGSHARPVLELVTALEKAVGKPARREDLPRHKGDVLTTSADVTHIREAYGFENKVALEDGVSRFVDWLKEWRAAQDAPSSASAKA
ncbi:SDR family NAD(P)-dependent oxidoreductase [Euryhalocaulis caribicus]|uniref:SDR family NAD(P)-dependent oxidoreductase n=1 Tax=Euryhalocaulis caribicus TaxID=1161401 RepID=UPI0003A28A4F|nr:SDR family NAD(P)-dependent oxidoreductase [Euryhalocaulis caribicus]